MTKTEYATRLSSFSRKDLLKLCRRAGFSANSLKTNEELINLLWEKVGKRAFNR
jgi:hypothetical protein